MSAFGLQKSYAGRNGLWYAICVNYIEGYESRKLIAKVKAQTSPEKVGLYCL